MASEDSDQLLLGRLPVHRLHDFGDLDQSVDTEVPTVRYQSHATRELLKVTLLSRAQRVGLEKRNYRFNEVCPTVHDELAQMLAVVVVPLGHIHTTYAEEASQLLERGSPADSLRHDKPMRHLVPGFVASAARSAWLPNKPDGEATLSVYKASNPTSCDQSFLLIVCTHDIFTVPPTWDGTRSPRYTDIPAFGRMRTAWLPMRGATFHLRTVIVTAAVYRGLASLLRVKP
jgi:hypothetical protein